MHQTGANILIAVCHTIACACICITNTYAKRVSAMQCLSTFPRKDTRYWRSNVNFVQQFDSNTMESGFCWTAPAHRMIKIPLFLSRDFISRIPVSLHLAKNVTLRLFICVGTKKRRLDVRHAFLFAYLLQYLASVGEQRTVIRSWTRGS